MLKGLQDLQQYDLFKSWGELAEFVEQKRIVVFCKNCVEEMDKYLDHMKTSKSTDKIIMPEPRAKDTNHGDIPVGILGSDNGRDKTLGLRCARQTYGDEAIEEILQGFIYKDDDGLRVKRLTVGDVDETTRCDQCWLPLWRCNARELMR